jgi:hypothetical protein
MLLETVLPRLFIYLFDQTLHSRRSLAMPCHAKYHQHLSWPNPSFLPLLKYRKNTGHMSSWYGNLRGQSRELVLSTRVHSSFVPVYQAFLPNELWRHIGFDPSPGCLQICP